MLARSVDGIIVVLVKDSLSMARPFQRKKYTASDANSWERTFGVLMTPFEAFARLNSSSGILLIFCTILALILANSPLLLSYEHLLHTPIGFSIGSYEISLSLHHWINDGLMAIFFYLVGLEIKHEIMVGELSSLKQAMLPIIGAIGGMVVPALIYAAINIGGEGLPGWGVPMATDIAFAITILVLLGNRVPASMMTILAALAIVDDLGAVVVIALFYTAQLHWGLLGLAGLCFVVMLVMNRMGIRQTWPYMILAVIMWFLMYFSGVHATIAGVLGAFATPANSVYQPKEFSRDARKLLDRFDMYRNREQDFLRSEKLTGVLNTLHMGINQAQTPLQRLEHTIQKPVYFLIIPIFALANAGVPLALGNVGAMFEHPVTIGVMFGLIVGKLVGVAGAILLAHFSGLAKLPQDMSVPHVLGMGLLAGIGFTMSIFIAELAFREMPDLLLHAKTAILFASIIAGLAGYFFLFFISKSKEV